MYLKYKNLNLDGNDFKEISYINSRVKEIFEENNLNKDFIQVTTRFIYGINKKYAERNGIEIDYIINKLSILGDISVSNDLDYFKNNPNVSGVFEICSNISKNTPCKIHIKKESPENNIDVYLHELTHLLSVDFGKKDDYIYFLKNGLKDNLIDECITETIKNEVMKEYVFDEEIINSLTLNSKIIFKKNVITSGVNILSIQLGSETSGYASINNMGELLKALYKDDIFISKFTPKDSLDLALNLDGNDRNYLDIVYSLKDVGNKSENNNYLGLLNINTIFKDMVKNYFKNHELSVEDYLKVREVLTKYSNSALILKDSENFFNNFYENLSNKYLNEIDIKNIYSKLVSGCNVEKELNPYTRSLECSATLASIEYILNNYKNTTFEDIKNIEISNIDLENNYLYFDLKIKDNVIRLSTEKNPISLDFDIINMDILKDSQYINSSFEKNRDLDNNKSTSFVDLQHSLKLLSLSDIAAINVSRDLDNIKTGNSKIDFLYKFFSGDLNNLESKEHLSTLKEFRDNQNNNLTHLLILGDIKTFNYLLYRLPEDELWNMLTEKNNYGKCTLDYLIDSNQFIKFEKICTNFREIKFNYNSNLIKDNLYNSLMDNNRLLIENTEDSLELLRKIKIGPNIALETIKQGVDCNLTDSKGYNACIYYAKVFNPAYTNEKKNKLFETLIEQTDISHATIDKENIFSFLASKKCYFPEDTKQLDDIVLKAISKKEFTLDLLNTKDGDVFPSFVSSGYLNSVKKIVDLGYDVASSPNFNKILKACDKLTKEEQEEMTKIFSSSQSNLIKKDLYQLDI